MGPCYTAVLNSCAYYEYVEAIKIGAISTKSSPLPMGKTLFANP